MDSPFIILIMDFYYFRPLGECLLPTIETSKPYQFRVKPYQFRVTFHFRLTNLGWNLTNLGWTHTNKNKGKI